MLHHISFAAIEPERVSRVLAELVKGHSYAFPVHPGSFITIADDAYGTAIEVYPQSSVCTPGEGEEQVIFERASFPQALSSTHIALSVPHEVQTVVNIGKREGWRVLPCNRGFFEVIELWVENHFLIEAITESMLPNYLETARSETWEKLLAGLTPVDAAELVARHQPTLR